MRTQESSQGSRTQRITSSGLMPVLERLISHPVTEALLTIAIRTMGYILGALSSLLPLEDIIIRLLKRPGVREAVMNGMARIKPVTTGVEPEMLWVFRELLRVRGVKETILPVAMSSGLIIETLAEPEVMEKLGDTEPYLEKKR